nr:hypothetical protein Iba_chr09cCG14130 [Ipomoea batatas]
MSTSAAAYPLAALRWRDASRGGGLGLGGGTRLEGTAAAVENSEFVAVVDLKKLEKEFRRGGRIWRWKWRKTSTDFLLEAVGTVKEETGLDRANFVVGLVRVDPPSPKLVRFNPISVEAVEQKYQIWMKKAMGGGGTTENMVEGGDDVDLEAVSLEQTTEKMDGGV